MSQNSNANTTSVQEVNSSKQVGESTQKIVKEKKPLKLSGASFVPTDNSLKTQSETRSLPDSQKTIAEQGAFQTTSGLNNKESKTDNQTQSQTKKTGKLKLNTTDFIPGQQSQDLLNQMEENKLEEDLYEDFDPQEAFEFEHGKKPEDVQDFEFELDDVNYFHEKSKDCDCCHGYVNKCKGAMCEMLGCCHCYATELEEQQFLEKEKKKSN